MNLFFLMLRSSWKASLASVVLGGASGLATLALITLIHKSFSNEGMQSTVLPALFVAACVAVLVLQILSKCILTRLSQSTAARLQFELCNRIMAAPLPELESVGPHRLLGTLQGDVGAITGALSNFPSVCASAMVLVSGIGYLANLSIPLAFCTVFMASIAVASYLAGVHWANYHLRRAREDRDEVTKQLQAMVFGIKELKANNRRCIDFIYEVLLPADTAMRQRLIKGTDILGGAHTWGRLSLFIGIGLLIFVWPRMWTVTPETLMGYTLTIIYLTSPLDNILGWLPALNHAAISLNKINALGLMIDPAKAPVVNSADTGFRSIEMRDISYSYQSPIEGETGFHLGPIDMQIRPGEALFIVGGNGCGKTTLAKILTGLYPAHSGEILVDRHVIDNASMGDYRQLFSTVFVEGHLFDRLLGNDLNPMLLRHWAHRLGIEDKVDFETGQLKTYKLSRGQHKRLAMLVACMDQRPVFVFDEWAAEQDPTFKEIFYREIVPELKQKGRAVVAITHDDRYFFAADRVVKIVDGKVETTTNERMVA
ncbi:MULTISPECIES: cyclic peptide export ABC transporter [Pirellulaceae]|uniref:Putative ATP-binding cassette transporter n=1 Tax=Aporhodopirellula rubra TaxID=980271 RepID=A0A7W5DX26_9BACT|nr:MULTISPECIES: cyclic peptide export ABC transporter [Pirellulaceae]EMI45585.1 ATP-binding protein syrD-ATP binding protein of ABC-type transporter [Rhodopirellula sp. SWK7]MBB3205774.1 putative ATP-binding cassette transporter [Aporhodopirellula rubra]